MLIAQKKKYKSSIRFSIDDKQKRIIFTKLFELFIEFNNK